MGHSTNAAQHRINQIAEDIGRIRRTAEPDSSLWHLADRLADNLEMLDVMVAPSAAELALWFAPGNDDAVEEAIRIVETRRDTIRSKMRTDEAHERAWKSRREKERLEVAA